MSSAPNPDLTYIKKDALPEAHWMIGGALRFDQLLINSLHFFNQHCPIVKFGHVIAQPACLWSLDWHEQRFPINQALYLQHLEKYKALDTGVILSFDNPFLSELDLQDNYGILLCQELVDRLPKDKCAVLVAHDGLSDKLREHFPQLAIYAHANRIIGQRVKRTAALYEKLTQSYDLVSLHPADAVRDSIIKALKQPEKYIITSNDLCPRNFPLRFEQLQELSNIRHNPYNGRAYVYAKQIADKIDPFDATTGPSSILSVQRKQELYDMGFRQFTLDAQNYRSPLSLHFDIISNLLTPDPSYGNKVQLVANSIASSLQEPKMTLNDGLSHFKTALNLTT